MTGPDGTPLLTYLQKGGGVQKFLGRIMDEAAPVPGIANLTLLGVEKDREAHILHSLFSVSVGPYNPN